MSDITRPDQINTPNFPNNQKPPTPVNKKKFEKDMEKIDIPLSPFEKNLVTNYGFKNFEVLQFRKLMLQITMTQMRQQMAQYTADIKKMFQDND